MTPTDAATSEARLSEELLGQGDSDAWHRVCSEESVSAPASRCTFTLPTGELTVVINHEGTLHALSATCTHRDLPLSDGLVRAGQIMCPWHRARFDLKTGVGTRPAPGPLKTFEVAVIDGTVCIRENKESR